MGAELEALLAEPLEALSTGSARRLPVMTGEVLEGVLSHTAAAQRRGDLGSEHVKTIRRFFDQLPSFVDHDIREAAEAPLAEIACGLRRVTTSTAPPPTPTTKPYAHWATASRHPCMLPTPPGAYNEHTACPLDR